MKLEMGQEVLMDNEQEWDDEQECGGGCGELLDDCTCEVTE